MSFNYLMLDPPTEIVVNGVEYPVNADFRNCMNIIAAFEDEELTEGEKVYILLDGLLGEVPSDTGAAIQAAIDFLDCGDSLKDSPSGRMYSLDQDSKFIRSAIEKTHKIRLRDMDLHWWEFCYMFLDLDEDSFFSKLLGIRYRKKRGKLTKEDRQFIQENADIVEIKAGRDYGGGLDMAEKIALIKKLGADGAKAAGVDDFTIKYHQAKMRRDEKLRQRVQEGSATEEEIQQDLENDIENRYDEALRRRLSEESEGGGVSG